MSIPVNTTGKIQYTGDGTTKSFPLTFPIFKKDDGGYAIRVSLSESSGENVTVLSEGLDYSVKETGSLFCDVVMNVAPTSEKVVTIIYDNELSQLYSPTDFTRLPAGSLINAFDKLTAICIQIKEEINRCIKETAESKIDPDVTMQKVNELHAKKAALEAIEQKLTQISRVSESIEDVEIAASYVNQIVETARYIQSVVVSADNIDAIVLSAAEIEAIKDAPAQATAAKESSESAAKSADTCASYAQNAHFDAGVATEKSDVAVSAAEKAEKAAISATRHSVGEIFYTNRLGDNLNGAVSANGYIYNCSDFTGEECVPALLEAGKLDYISMEAYEDLLKGDPVNGECFGGALWADGTYSANYTNYFKPDKNIPFSEADTWEFETRFLYRAQGGTSGRAILGTDETKDYQGPILYVNTSGAVLVTLGTTGTNWLTANTSVGVTLTAETEYDLKLGFDGEKYYFAYKLTTAEEWTTSWTLANATKVFSTGNIMLGNCRLNTAALTTFWNAGYIRLPRTKILINGEVYWQGGTGRQPQKSVKVFGWDGPGATTFRVPTAEKPKRVLVAKKEATATDQSWWNWYSDGWIEQGGYISAQTSIVDITVTYSIHFIDGNHYFNRTAKDVKQYGNNYASYWSGAYGKTSAGCTFRAEANTWCSGYDWYACGYGAIPTEAGYQFQNIEVHRAMVQVATGNTDQSLVTATSVLPRMNRLESRFRIVQSLPDNPDPETFYFVIRGE